MTFQDIWKHLGTWRCYFLGQQGHIYVLWHFGLAHSGSLCWILQSYLGCPQMSPSEALYLMQRSGFQRQSQPQFTCAMTLEVLRKESICKRPRSWMNSGGDHCSHPQEALVVLLMFCHQPGKRPWVKCFHISVLKHLEFSHGDSGSWRQKAQHKTGKIAGETGIGKHFPVLHCFVSLEEEGNALNWKSW